MCKQGDVLGPVCGAFSEDTHHLLQRSNHFLQYHQFITQLRLIIMATSAHVGYNPMKDNKTTISGTGHSYYKYK